MSDETEEISQDPYDLIRDDIQKIKQYRELENEMWVAEVTVNDEMKAMVDEQMDTVKPEAELAASKFATIHDEGVAD